MRVPVTRLAVIAVAVGLAAFPAFGPARAMAPDPASDRADDPANLDRTTARNLRLALKAADRHSWKMYRRYRGRIKHPAAAKVADWRAMLKGDPKADFAVLRSFLRANPTWPSWGRLRRRAEERLADDKDIPPAEVIAWFGPRDPVTALGQARLGHALMARGHAAAGRAMIRRAWIQGNFNRHREKRFYARNRAHLTKADHLARLDRLLWDGKYWPSKRMMRRVGKDQRLLAEARLVLRRDLGNPDRAVARVPAHLKSHPGMLYERLRWRRRKNLDTAVDLLKELPPAVPRAEKFWHERSTLARRLLRKGHISEAYRVTAGHRLVKVQAAAYAEAEWTAGWIAFRFLGELADARRHFTNMHGAVRYPISVSRGAYWLGRVAEAAQDEEARRTWYAAAAKHARAYYGQLAAARLSPGASLPIAREPEPSIDERLAFDAHELAVVVRMLGENGAHDYLKPFVLALAAARPEPAWKSLTARLARLSGRPDLSVHIAKRAGRSGIVLPEAGYPSLTPPALPRHLKTAAPEVPLVLAVIRQESAFRVKARSRADAQGLMQLLPSTARRVAKSLGMRYVRRRLTTDPDYNMTLGQAYLARMLQEFKGSAPLALAAYNAGPARAQRWIKRNGDPRTKDVDAIDWVEMIPFDETRTYVQRVLANLQVYRSRLADTEVALALESDLHQ